jgi:hypothetical protein
VAIDGGKPAADGGTDGQNAAKFAQVVTAGGAQPTDGAARVAGGGIQPGGGEAAKVAPEDDPEAAAYKVSDCQGGHVIAPLWIRHVPFWAALCVHGLPGKSLRVDVGTSLILHEDLENGDAANLYQVYYALDQVRVPANGKSLVWAMCGGGGEWLKSGTRVVPTHRLPAAKSDLIAKQVDTLRAIEADFVMFMKNLQGAKTEDDIKYYKRGVAQLKIALIDAAGLLRDAVIKDNRMILSRPPTAQPSNAKSPRPKGPRTTTPGGPSGIPDPIIP